MIKLALMLIWTLGGVAGGLAYSPFVPVLVYHFYSVLRPQFMWEFSLAPYVSNDFPWSFLVAIAAIGSSFIWRSAFWLAPHRFKGLDLPRFNIGHACFGFCPLPENVAARYSRYASRDDGASADRYVQLLPSPSELAWWSASP